MVYVMYDGRKEAGSLVKFVAVVLDLVGLKEPCNGVHDISGVG